VGARNKIHGRVRLKPNPPGKSIRRLQDPATPRDLRRGGETAANQPAWLRQGVPGWVSTTTWRMTPPKRNGGV
jgi:hypothetical protein